MTVAVDCLDYLAETAVVTVAVDCLDYPAETAVVTVAVDCLDYPAETAVYLVAAAAKAAVYPTYRVATVELTAACPTSPAAAKAEMAAANHQLYPNSQPRTNGNAPTAGMIQYVFWIVSAFFGSFAKAPAGEQTVA